MNNFVNDEFVKWIGVIGSVASLIGLPVAIWQIYKTRRAAEAATNAALQTQRTISRNFLVFNISTCIKHTEEIKFYLLNEKYELATVRSNDLISQLIQIQEVLKVSDQAHQIDFLEILSELTSIRNNFGKKLIGSSVKISKIRIISQLDIVSDNLNKLIGETKIVIEKGA